MSKLVFRPCLECNKHCEHDSNEQFCSEHCRMIFSERERIRALTDKEKTIMPILLSDEYFHPCRMCNKSCSVSEEFCSEICMMHYIDRAKLNALAFALNRILDTSEELKDAKSRNS